MEDTLQAKGELVIELRDEFGNLKDYREVKNLVVTVGRQFIASRMVGTSAAVMSHMAIGTSSAAAAAANTGLGTEVARVAFSTAGSATATTVTYQATFPANTPSTAQAIVEAGVFNAPTAGTMLCRTTFDVINKAAADQLSITWNITINAA